jgi:hypothetical protein
MSKAKKINCKWCGMGHQPRPDGDHRIVKSIIPSRIDIRECAYHKAGAVSPIVLPSSRQTSPAARIWAMTGLVTSQHATLEEK